LLRLAEGVIPPPAAVSCQVGLDAMAHGRSHHLGRKVADHVGAVGVAVPAGVGHELLALGFVLLPELVPERAPVQVLPDVVAAEAGTHRREIGRAELVRQLPVGCPVIAGQQPQDSRFGLAAGGHLFIGAPQAPIAQLQVLELLGSQSISCHQLECESPTRVGQGPYQRQDVANFEGW
jgi:hypothetical protein